MRVSSLAFTNTFRVLKSAGRQIRAEKCPNYPKFGAVTSFRSFSSDGRKEDYKSIDEEAYEENIKYKDPDSFLGKYGSQVKLASMVGGGSIVFYGISRLFYDVTYQFLSLTPAISLKYGFYGGALTAFGMAGGALSLMQGIRPNPEAAFHRGLNLANQNEDLRSLLGGMLQYSAQDIKLYKSRGGSFGVVNGSVSFKNPKCELAFTGTGPQGKANVVVIYSQKMFSSPVVEFVGADIVSTAGTKGISRRTRVVIEGSKDGNDDAEWAVLDKLVKSSELAYRDTGK